VYLNPEIPSQGNLFKEAGYRTGFTGKWHAGALDPGDDLPEFPENPDLDDPGIDKKLQQYQKILSENIKRNGGYDYAEGIVWGNNSNYPCKELNDHHIEWSIQKTLEFLDTCSADEPFLLHDASNCVHGPACLGKVDRDPHYTLGGKVYTLPEQLPQRTEIASRLEAMGKKVNHHTASVLWLDDQIGVILDKLEEMGVIDNTILVFCTDHGVEPGKTTIYERGINVPYFIAAPGMKKNNVSQMMVQNTDMLPTLLDLCGIEYDADQFDGVSLRPVLEGREEEVHDDLFFEFGYMRGIRTPKWKYISLRYPEHVIEKMENGEYEVGPNQTDRYQPNAQVGLSFYKMFYDPDQLFDLENDPWEENNLAGNSAYEETLQEMKNRMHPILEKQPHPYSLDIPGYMQTSGYRDLVQKRVDLGPEIVGWFQPGFWDELL
jgi:arylsulfatase A-like enzyme